MTLDLDNISPEEERLMKTAFLEETEVTCPSCGGEIILVFDFDGWHTWLHEIWRTCGCSGVILDVHPIFGGGQHIMQLLIVEAPHAD